MEIDTGMSHKCCKTDRAYKNLNMVTWDPPPIEHIFVKSPSLTSNMEYI